jgi:hypothetical protein
MTRSKQIWTLIHLLHGVRNEKKISCIFMAMTTWSQHIFENRLCHFQYLFRYIRNFGWAASQIRLLMTSCFTYVSMTKQTRCKEVNCCYEMSWTAVISNFTDKVPDDFMFYLCFYMTKQTVHPNSLQVITDERCKQSNGEYNLLLPSCIITHLIWMM